MISETSGEPATWSAQWASDTIAVGHAAFTGLHFAGKKSGSTTAPPQWTVTGTHASSYQSRAEDVKAAQLAKAGARLAQLLKALWPQTGSQP